MAAAELFSDLSRATNANSESLSGATWKFYASGTSTPQAVYADGDLGSSLGAEVEADGGGLFPPIYFDSSLLYRGVQEDADGNPVRDIDPINTGILSQFSGVNGADQIGTSSGDTVQEILDANSDKLAKTIYVTDPEYGALGNGSADDTEAIQRALDYAAQINGTVEIPLGFTYGISGLLYIKPGVSGLVGRGGVIKILSSATDLAGIVLFGKEGLQAENVQNCLISGLIFDCNDKNALAIVGQNISYCTITGNRILNCSVGVGILIRSYINGGESARNNIITNNQLDLAGNAAGVGILMDGQSLITDAPANWKANFTSPDAQYPVIGSIIANNRVDGGLYGISIGCGRYNIIMGNRLAQQTRNISIQNSSTSNLILGNVCTESESSSIHMAYGCSFNLVKGNIIYSTVAVGEGVIQAYVGSTHNLVEGNSITTAVSTPQYHLYAAVHSDYNVFANNKLYGRVAKAYLCAESAWNTATTETSSRAYANDVGVNDYANQGMSGVAFVDNHIFGTATRPAICLIQTSDAGANSPYALSGVVVKGNVLVSDTYSEQIKLHEDTSGSLTSLILKENEFNPTSASSKFVMPRGRAHFAEWSGNGALDTEMSGSTTTNLGSISAGATATVSITVTGAAVGDFVCGWATSAALPTGVVVSACTITATDTVVMTLLNTTGGGLDPANMTYSVIVRRRMF